MRLPARVTEGVRAKLRDLLEELQARMREHNPYAAGLISACNIPREELEDQKLLSPQSLRRAPTQGSTTCPKGRGQRYPSCSALTLTGRET